MAAAAATGGEEEKNFKVVEIPPKRLAKFFKKEVEEIYKKARTSVEAVGTAAHRSAASAQRSPDGDSTQRSAQKMQEEFLGKGGGAISATMSAEAMDWFQKENSHAHRRYDISREHKGKARMKNADALSQLVRAQEQAVDAQIAAAPARPAPLYGNGQSAIQWWANWMKNATELPKSYNKGNRPSWYSAEITAYVGWKEDRKYCGVPQACHFYAVY